MAIAIIRIGSISWHVVLKQSLKIRIFEQPEKPLAMEQKKRSILFWVVNGLIALVILIFIIQNWDKVTFTFLWLEIKGYGFLVYPVIFLLGFLSSWLWSLYRDRRKQRAEKDRQETYQLEE